MTEERLESIRMALEEIRALCARRELLAAVQRRDMEAGQRALWGKQARGGQGQSDALWMQAHADRLRKLDEAICARIAAREREVLEVYDWMQALPAEERLVVRLRYVDGLRWDVVARKAGYSEKHVYKIRRRLFGRERRNA